MAGKTVTQPADATDEAWALVPDSCRDLADPQRDLPRIARDQILMAQIESAVRSVPTRDDLHLGDARRITRKNPTAPRLPGSIWKEYCSAGLNQCPQGSLGEIQTAQRTIRRWRT